MKRYPPHQDRKSQVRQLIRIPGSVLGVVYAVEHSESFPSLYKIQKHVYLPRVFCKHVVDWQKSTCSEIDKKWVGSGVYKVLSNALYLIAFEFNPYSPQLSLTELLLFAFTSLLPQLT